MRPAHGKARADLGTHAEDLEEVRPRLDRAHAHRVQAWIGQVHVRPPPGRGVREHGQCAVVHEVDGGERLVGDGALHIGVPQGDEAVGLSVGKGPQDHAVHEGIDDGAGARAQAENENGEEGEAAVGPELAQPGPQGLPGGHAGQAARAVEVGARLLQHGEPRFPEGAQRFVARLRVHGPPGARGLVEIFEMSGQLLDGVIVEVRRAGGPRLADHDRAPVDHAGLTPATRPRAAMNRLQSARWAARTFRPSSVMR